MGVSTDGHICFGIAFGDGFKFPWDTEENYQDIDSWWVYGVLGFKHSFELYDEKGNYINGVKPAQEDIDRYYDEKRQFEAANKKLPVQLVNYCSGDYPMYILAVPRTYLICSRGCPADFDPSELAVTDEETAALLQFCADHDIEHDAKPKWLLSSYWG